MQVISTLSIFAVCIHCTTSKNKFSRHHYKPPAIHVLITEKSKKCKVVL